MLPSPAKGTPLETNPNVADVQAACTSPMSAPGANPSMSCGSGLGSLRGLRSVTVNHRDAAESTCRKKPTDCEEVEIPSEYSSAPDAVDSKIVRPVSGGPPGSTAEVLVTLVRK